MGYAYNFELEDNKRLAKLKKIAGLLKAGKVSAPDNLFSQIIIGMMKERKRRFREKDWDEVVNLYPPAKLFQPAIAMGIDLEKLIRVKRFMSKVKEKMRVRDVLSQKKNVANLRVEEFMDASEIEMQRQIFGLLKQICDVASGFFENMHKALVPDTISQTFLLEQFMVKPQAEAPNSSLEAHSKTPKGREFINNLYLVMVEAIKEIRENWKNSLYMGPEELLKGAIGRLFKKKRKAKYQRQLYECLIDKDSVLDALVTDEVALRKKPGVFLDMIKDLKRKPDFRDSNGLILIEQVAKELDVTAETLRNWDKKGIFKAALKKHNGKTYRAYNADDMPALRRIKAEQDGKRRHVSEGYFTIATVANVLGVSARTIIRKEEAGELPVANRDKDGSRIYTPAEAKAIKNILGK